ncbi:MAG: hypothetical protein IJ632_03900 [Muribaculaceae bacterium]|nr:hypothetical protein [Muribaculaceae bacterium]
MVLAIVALATAAASIFAPDDAARIIAALLVAGAVPMLVYGRCRNASAGGMWVLLVLWGFMAMVGVMQLREWCLMPTFSFDSPDLKSDAGCYYNWAIHHYNGSVPEPKSIVFKGFPLLMTLLFHLLGPNVLWPLTMNMMFTLLAVVVGGQACWRLLHPVVDYKGSFTSTLAMAMTGTLMYYVSQGLAIQKEASIYLGMALTTYVLAGMAKHADDRCRLTLRDALLFGLGCIIMGFVRTTFLYCTFVGIGLMTAAHPRLLWRKGCILLTIALAAFTAGNMHALYSLEQHMVIMEGSGAMSRTFLTGHGPSAPYMMLLGPYFSFSVLHRLALLPFVMSVQFFIPFPWTYNNFDFLRLFLRMAWGWYIIGGIALFYYLFLSWRRPVKLGVWPWLPVVLFAGIAYIIGGSVNRYVLPIEPLFVPVAVYVVCLLRQGLFRKPFAAWAVFFVAVVVVTLAVCHHIQIEYFESLDAYYRSLMP